MKWIRKWSPLVLALYLVVQSFVYVGMYRDYSRYKSSSDIARERLISMYVQGEDVAYMQSQIAHLSATAGMRLSAMKEFLWDTVYVMIPFVTLYTFIYILSLLPRDRSKRDEAEVKPTKVDPYMTEEIGVKLFDDRDGPGVH